MKVACVPPILPDPASRSRVTDEVRLQVPANSLLEDDGNPDAREDSRDDGDRKPEAEDGRMGHGLDLPIVPELAANIQNPDASVSAVDSLEKLLARLMRAHRLDLRL